MQMRGAWTEAAILERGSHHADDEGMDRSCHVVHSTDLCYSHATRWAVVTAVDNGMDTVAINIAAVNNPERSSHAIRP